MVSSIKWTERALLNNLEQMPQRARQYLNLTTQQQAAQSETFMKTNAPWTDRSTNARSGLAARPVVDMSAGKFSIVVYHQVPYGIWLEIAHEKRFEIITTTVKTMTPRFTKLATQVLQRSIGPAGGSSNSG